MGARLRWTRMAGAAASSVVLALALMTTPAATGPAGATATGADWSTVRVYVPGATPRFALAVRDYVVRADATGTCDTVVSVRTPPEITAAFTGQRPKSGRSGRRVEVAPGQRVSFTLAAGADARTFSVRCLPAEFPTLTVTGRGTAEWYLTAETFLGTPPAFAYVLDAHGTPVWWRTNAATRPANVILLNQVQLSAVGVTAPRALGWFEGQVPHFVTLDGQSHTYPVSADRHDFVVTSRDTVLTIHQVLRACPTDPSTCVDMRQYGGRLRAEVKDGEIREYDRDGNLVWRWSTADHTELIDSVPWLRSRFMAHARVSNRWDLAHINALVDLGDAVLMSARHLDAIYKIDKDSGRVLWKLGGRTTADSLTIVGDGRTKTLDGPHDVQVLPDGTVSAYDNGSLTRRPPRVIRFRIDDVARTATVLQVITFEPASTSRALGGARRLANGNWVVTWGRTPWISEMSGNGRAIFTVDVGSDTHYRTIPVERGILPAEELRSGMDAMYGGPR